ncbi:hypothetical protein HU200_022630 [Digitaria exilis]|uniref:DNA excision repair protein ERCC-1 n=1 Tax=Digitaria exilis TaxID=1010633 RepID=A0A835C4F6_9POAL|nr:hypothetical protein HU200_022630 [Digitaria exilis]
MDGEKEQQGAPERQPGKNLIKIPSYQEVFGTGSTSSSSTPPSYNPPLPSAGTPAASTSSSSSGSFSQAFSFLKSSEFYSPPPPPPPQPASHPEVPSSTSRLLVLSDKGTAEEFSGSVSSCAMSILFESKLSEQTIPSCSLEECGRYLETIKVYENKPADNIREHMDNDYLSRFTHALTSIRHVNKTDVVTLGSSFGSLSQVMNASMEELARCPGIGERKVKRLHDTFHEPFKRVSVRRNFVVPDTPDREKASGQPSSMNDSSENTAEKSEASKNKKGSDVRSALTAAFAKYSEKIRSQSSEAANEAGEGASSSNREEAKTKD